jgi:integrase
MHVRKLPSGNWRVIIQHAGQRRSITAATKREAQQLAAAELLNLGASPTEQITVAELLDLHLAAAADQLSPSTMALYRGSVRRLPEPFLARNVAAVDARVLHAMYQQLLAGGMSAHTVKRTHGMLGSAWQRAVQWGYDTRNPVRHVSPPTTTTPEIEPPTPAEVGRLLEVADLRHGLLLTLAMTTGARRGELVGLQWADIRFDSSEMIVRRSLVIVGGGVQERDTKTGRKGHRVVALGGETVELLRRWRTSQVKMALAGGLPDPVWVFSHDAGVTPWRPDYVTSAFNRLRRQADVTCRFHDLRHFAATQLLSAGLSLSQVAGRLGHANMTTTAKVYAHFVQADDREAATILDRLVFPA